MKTKYYLKLSYLFLFLFSLVLFFGLSNKTYATGPNQTVIDGATGPVHYSNSMWQFYKNYIGTLHSISILASGTIGDAIFQVCDSGGGTDCAVTPVENYEMNGGSNLYGGNAWMDLTTSTFSGYTLYTFTVTSTQSDMNLSLADGFKITFTGQGALGVSAVGSTATSTQTPVGLANNEGVSLNNIHDIYVVSNSGGGGSNPVNVDLNFPTPVITQDFNQFIVSSTLDEGGLYTIYLSYVPEIGSFTGEFLTQSFQVGPSGPNGLFYLNKVKNLWAFWNGTSTKFDWTVAVADTGTGIYLGSATGTFTLETIASSNVPFGFDITKRCGGLCTNFGQIGSGSFPTSSTSTANANNVSCPPASDWTDIGGGLRYGFCSTINYLFYPSASSTEAFNDHVNAITKVPPFGWLWATYYVTGNVSTMTSTPTDIVAYNAPNFVNGEIVGTTTWVVASVNNFDSPLQGHTYGSGTTWTQLREVWFNFVIYAVCGFLLLIIIIVLKHLI